MGSGLVPFGLNVSEISSEIGLIFAQEECVNAYEAVNKIRRRAEIPELNGLDQQQLREAIWREKWYELCYESKIWFNMVQIRKAFNLNTREFEEYVGHTFVYGPTLGEREFLYPIPNSEIRNNSNLTQNPGY